MASDHGREDAHAGLAQLPDASREPHAAEPAQRLKRCNAVVLDQMPADALSLGVHRLLRKEAATARPLGARPGRNDGAGLVSGGNARKGKPINSGSRCALITYGPVA